MKSIGLRIKEARLAKNMKQDELAARIGAKSPSAVSMISFMFRYCSVMVSFTVPVPHFSFKILVMCCIVFLRASKEEIS